MTSMPARAGCTMIRLYQLAKVGRVSPCRFQPSCSTYAYGALERHGLCRGTLLALRRLLRCRPGGSWGYDPVPD